MPLDNSRTNDMANATPRFGRHAVTRLRVSASLAAVYILAAILTGCHDVPATYTAPTSTWEDQ